MATKEKQSGFVDNWQNGKTLPECNLHMLETEDFCDVSFRVGSEGHVIQAHRYVLVSRSCVFHAMFCGQMAEQGEIIIPDIEADVFKDFLRFLYTDNVVLTLENATGLLYTSRKYDVDGLFTQCASFLENSLTEYNVCEILETCHDYGEVDIEQQALKMLKQSGERTLKSSGFPKLCTPCFEKFLTSDDLQVKEEDVFEASLAWAKERCNLENLTPSPANQRKVLGNLIYKIPFPALSFKFLTTVVRKSQVLTVEERMSLVDKIENPDIDISPFSSRQLKEKRDDDGVHYVNRFRNGWTATIGYPCDNSWERISFSTNRNIKLIGCLLYGSVHTTDNKYTITMVLHDELGSVISEPLKSKCVLIKGKSELNDIMFPESVDVCSGRRYTVCVNLRDGPNYNLGSQGRQTHEVDGVKFSFMHSNMSYLGSRTGVDEGQIPGLIWRHC